MQTRGTEEAEQQLLASVRLATKVMRYLGSNDSPVTIEYLLLVVDAIQQSGIGKSVMCNGQALGRPRD